MIEQFFEEVIKELGTSGLLIVGLYFLLYKPLASMAKHIHNINDELAGILRTLISISANQKK